MSLPPAVRPHLLLWFILVAALGWGCRWVLVGFVWIPSAPDISHTISTLVGLVLVLGITWLLLRREGHTWAAIGFSLRGDHLRPAGFGAGVSVAVVAAVSLVLTFVLHGSWHVGTASWPYVLLSLQAYFWGSILEELMFRGYLLRRLMQWWGRGWALAVLCLAFGLFHLPGLSGVVAWKMVATTAACGLLFSALTLRTGSLWSAIAAHAAMNWVLHTVLGGTGKPGLLRPEFTSSGPLGVDVGFWSLLLFAGGTGLLLLPRSAAVAAETSGTVFPPASGRQKALITETTP